MRPQCDFLTLVVDRAGKGVWLQPAKPILRTRVSQSGAALPSHRLGLRLASVRCNKQRVSEPKTAAQWRKQSGTCFRSGNRDVPSQVNQQGGGASRLPPAVQRRPREALKLALRWNACDRLALLPASAIKAAQLSSLTAVAKTPEADRLILERQRRNAAERHLGRATSELAPSWRLCELVLAPQEDLYEWSSDIQEFLYSFALSAERAATNGIAARFAVGDFSHTRAGRAVNAPTLAWAIPIP